MGLLGASYGLPNVLIWASCDMYLHIVAYMTSDIDYYRCRCGLYHYYCCSLFAPGVALATNAATSNDRSTIVRAALQLPATRRASGVSY